VINGVLLMLIIAASAAAICVWHSPAALDWLIAELRVRRELIFLMRKHREERTAERARLLKEWREERSSQPVRLSRQGPQPLNIAQGKVG
jgi:hypothetical protein